MKKFRYELKHRHATWLELFFDLVFVACIGIVTHNLAHTHHGHIAPRQFLLFPLQFLAIWWIWTTHTLFANRLDADSGFQRIASLVIMFLMITMSAFLGSDLFENYGRFIAFYVAIRLVLSSSYFQAAASLDQSRQYALHSGLAIVAGALISGASVFFSSPFREIILCTGIVLEMIAMPIIARRESPHAIHREHLVERIGLMSIILLGESIISLVGGLREVAWDSMNIMAAVTGFLMIGLIWWIYYDSFPVLEKIKAMTQGFGLIYSHFFLAMGLVILASLIGHVILDDLAQKDIRILAISGMCFFYIGKQTAYYMWLPPYRFNLLLNTLVCISITIASTFLPEPAYVLIGITVGMAFYTYSNFRWTLSKDVSDHLGSSDEAFSQ